VARATPSSARSPLLIFLLVAVLLGLAAASLLAPTPGVEGVDIAPSVHAPAAPAWLPIAIVLAIVGSLFLVGGISRGRPTWIVGLIAVCLAIGTVLVYLFRFFGTGSPGVNRTANQTVQTCNSNPALCNYAFPVGPSSPTIAPWYAGAALYGLILVTVVVAVILVPRVLAMRNRHYTGRGSPDDGRATHELETALARLSESGPGDDARRRIIRAYGELLTTVGSRLPDLETATPREIAEQIELKFGIRPETAEELTELFEEARYSRDRPMASDAVDRAEAALRRALDESTVARGPVR